tara:strand:- start:68 stop:700 length:633 start_codon:yes stop_codon:yes gene_type:complete
MGYLDNTTVTVDAILTKKGRELLAQGGSAFEITKFALSDDEVDYNLYMPAHTEGTSKYGEAIEAMPVVEAVPDQNYILRHKLITLPKGNLKLPKLGVGGSTTFDLSNLNPSSPIITPTVTNFQSLDLSQGFTFVIGDTDVVIPVNWTPVSGTPVGSGNTRVAKSMQFQARPQTTEAKSTTVTITGRASGGHLTLTFNVAKDVVNNDTFAS